jgi:hypothetical protein
MKSVTNWIFYLHDFFRILIPFIAIFPMRETNFRFCFQSFTLLSSGSQLSVTVSAGASFLLAVQGGGHRIACLPCVKAALRQLLSEASSPVSEAAPLVQSCCTDAGPSALHRRLRASASTSGVVHSIEAKPTPCCVVAVGEPHLSLSISLSLGRSTPPAAQCHQRSRVTSPPPSFHPEMPPRRRSCDVLATPPPR